MEKNKYSMSGKAADEMIIRGSFQLDMDIVVNLEITSSLFLAESEFFGWISLMQGNPTGIYFEI